MVEERLFGFRYQSFDILYFEGGYPPLGFDSVEGTLRRLKERSEIFAIEDFPAREEIYEIKDGERLTIKYYEIKRLNGKLNLREIS